MDGSTIGVVSNNHVVNPSVYKKMPFDALNDITPISVVGATPLPGADDDPALTRSKIAAAIDAAVHLDGARRGQHGNIPL